MEQLQQPSNIHLLYVEWISYFPRLILNWNYLYHVMFWKFLNFDKFWLIWNNLQRSQVHRWTMTCIGQKVSWDFLPKAEPVAFKNWFALLQTMSWQNFVNNFQFDLILTVILFKNDCFTYSLCNTLKSLILNLCWL